MTFNKKTPLMTLNQLDPAIVFRAQGCLLGQLAGDALGGLVEFQTLDKIRAEYPRGVRELANGGTWNTIAGQPTDDSEMALMLARTLVKQGRYDAEEARRAYLFWLHSDPFDCGGTILRGLCGRPDSDSQANGAMMRVSPLGIFGANYNVKQVAAWAKQDAALTHPNPVCLQVNALFAMAIAHAVSKAIDARELYGLIEAWAKEMNAENAVLRIIVGASTAPPSDYVHQRGWVLIAFHNALWQLLHASSLKEGVVDTVMHGGDTDTNAAIAGALLGAVHGREAIPAQWVEKLLSCRPEVGLPHIRHPRPKCFWPVDALELAEQLVSAAGQKKSGKS
jgi:ADP-ribosyl-[dinitrogen reductase] hydrolase